MSDLFLPQEYKAICLDKYMGRIHIALKNFRPLQSKEILVKVSSTTIHPFDILFINGEYGEIEPKSFPIVPGFEGSGKVIAVEDESDKHLIGKQVACFANANKEGYFEGLWAEYHYTTVESIMYFETEKDLPDEKITFLINPITAAGMYDTAIKAKATSILQTDADSQLGRMFIRLCKHYGQIETINLVKNYSHCKELTAMGTPNILVCEEEWELECKKLCHLLKTQIAFDTIGGEMTGKILSFLPEDGVLYHLGNLYLKEVNKIRVDDLLFKGKSVIGFWMVRWLRSLSADEYQYWWDFIRLELQKQSHIFETKLSKIFKIEEIDQAINFYVSNLLEGSVLIKF